MLHHLELRSESDIDADVDTSADGAVKVGFAEAPLHVTPYRALRCKGAARSDDVTHDYTFLAEHQGAGSRQQVAAYITHDVDVPATDNQVAVDIAGDGDAAAGDVQVIVNGIVNGYFVAADETGGLRRSRCRQECDDDRARPRGFRGL